MSTGAIDGEPEKSVSEKSVVNLVAVAIKYVNDVLFLVEDVAISRRVNSGPPGRGGR